MTNATAYDRTIELMAMRRLRGELNWAQRQELLDLTEKMILFDVARIREAAERRQQEQKKRMAPIDLTDFSNWEVH